MPPPAIRNFTGCIDEFLIFRRALSGEQVDELPDDPERPVAIVFTSGTTGRPKGAVFAGRQLAFITGVDTGNRWGGGGHTLAGTSLAHLGPMTKLPGNLMRGSTTHLLRRWRADDIVRSGIPRTKRPVTAIRGALWARTDKQAALLLTMTVQQGLVRPEDLAHELLRVKKAGRCLLLHEVVNDLLDGARSLGELEMPGSCVKVCGESQSTPKRLRRSTTSLLEGGPSVVASHRSPNASARSGRPDGPTIDPAPAVVPIVSGSPQPTGESCT